MNASASAGAEEVRFEEGANFACLMPLRRGRQPPLGDLLGAISKALAGSGAAVALDPLHRELMPRTKGGTDVPRWLDRGTAFLLVNEVRIMIAWKPSDSPRRSWLSTYVNRHLWPDAARDLARCRAAAVITEMGIPGEDGLAAAFDRAAALTIVAEALWPLVAGIGLLWSPAQNALPAARLGDAFDTVRCGRAALSLWMRWHEVAPEGSDRLSPGLATSGLRPILGREIEAAPSPIPTEEMRQHIVHLASGLIDHQAEIKDGHRLERRSGPPITLRLAESGLREGVPAYLLSVEAEAA